MCVSWLNSFEAMGSGKGFVLHTIHDTHYIANVYLFISKSSSYIREIKKGSGAKA